MVRYVAQNDRLCQLMRRKGILQFELAEKIERSTSMVSNWVHSKRNIGEKDMRAICDAYNVDIEWLRDGKGTLDEAIGTDEPLLFGSNKFPKDAISEDGKYVKTIPNPSSKEAIEAKRLDAELMKAIINEHPGEIDFVQLMHFYDEKKKQLEEARELAKKEMDEYEKNKANDDHKAESDTSESVAVADKIDNSTEIEKIVIFYKDKTFSVYTARD